MYIMYNVIISDVLIKNEMGVATNNILHCISCIFLTIYTNEFISLTSSLTL